MFFNLPLLSLPAVTLTIAYCIGQSLSLIGITGGVQSSVASRNCSLSLLQYALPVYCGLILRGLQCIRGLQCKGRHDRKGYRHSMPRNDSIRAIFLGGAFAARKSPTDRHT